MFKFPHHGDCCSWLETINRKIIKAATQDGLLQQEMTKFGKQINYYVQRVYTHKRKLKILDCKQSNRFEFFLSVPMSDIAVVVKGIK